MEWNGISVANRPISFWSNFFFFQVIAENCQNYQTSVLQFKITSVSMELYVNDEFYRLIYYFLNIDFLKVLVDQICQNWRIIK